MNNKIALYLRVHSTRHSIRPIVVEGDGRKLNYGIDERQTNRFYFILSERRRRSTTHLESAVSEEAMLLHF